MKSKKALKEKEIGTKTENPAVMQPDPSHEEWSVRKARLFGPVESRQEVMRRIEENDEVCAAFKRLTENLQEEFISFCMGVQGLNVTYDPVFKLIFDPVRHPERLENFLTYCLKKDVKILRVMQNESQKLVQDGTYLAMDIVVRLKSKETANIEIQRVGYLFPGQRCACYSSDLVMRQYSQVHEEKKKAGKKFSYQDIKTVYTIVLIKDSPGEFKGIPDRYLHYGRQQFDTGLELDMLQEYLLIPLDIFMENRHNISNKLDAWLYFLASDSPEDIRKVVEAYPEFEEMYREIFYFRYHVEELMSMFSESLRILDRNTVEYMIELKQAQVERLEAENRRLEEEKRLEAEKHQEEQLESQRTIEVLQQKLAQLKSRAAVLTEKV